MKQDDFSKKVRKVLINKYSITLYIFAVLFLFVGEQGLINQIARKREIRQTQQEIERVTAETKHSENLLRSLDNKDSLERFAREQYKMHTNEMRFPASEYYNFLTVLLKSSVLLLPPETKKALSIGLSLLLAIHL